MHTSLVTEKVWTSLGHEFGKDAKKTAVIVRVLYGLKSSGTAFRSHLAICMEWFGYMSCRADQISGSNQKPDQRTRYSITPFYCVMWITIIASITMQH